MLQTKIDKDTNVLTITIDLNGERSNSNPKETEKGSGVYIVKSERIATSGGAPVIGMTEDGLPVKLNLNCFAMKKTPETVSAE